jgi:hypothetical protein
MISILYYVEYFRHKFTRACEIEQDNLKQSQDKMKHWYEMFASYLFKVWCILSKAPRDSGRYAFRLNSFVFNLIDAYLAEINETFPKTK